MFNLFLSYLYRLKTYNVYIAAFTRTHAHTHKIFLLKKYSYFKKIINALLYNQ